MFHQDIEEGQDYIIDYDAKRKVYSWEGANLFEDYCSEDHLESLEAANKDAQDFLSTVKID